MLLHSLIHDTDDSVADQIWVNENEKGMSKATIWIRDTH